jgi:hypothetical protein
LALPLNRPCLSDIIPTRPTRASTARQIHGRLPELQFPIHRANHGEPQVCHKMTCQTDMDLILAILAIIDNHMLSDCEVFLGLAFVLVSRKDYAQ